MSSISRLWRLMHLWKIYTLVDWSSNYHVQVPVTYTSVPKKSVIRTCIISYFYILSTAVLAKVSEFYTN